MSKPRILLPTANYVVPARIAEVDFNVAGLRVSYIEAVARSGGVPILLPPLSSTAIESYLDVASGLLLSGGVDIDPKIYGEVRHPSVSCVDPIRDHVELELARAAFERGIPILGICRGLQILNVMANGTLIQDIPTAIANAERHSPNELYPSSWHSTTIVASSSLGNLLKISDMSVNSYHHQCIGRLGDGLRVNCYSSDGIIEGIESDNGQILGVQFHPEETANSNTHFQQLFQWLIDRSTAWNDQTRAK